MKNRAFIFVALIVSTIAIVALGSFAATSNVARGDKITELAKTKVGAKFSYGAQGEDKFDSSGFIWWAYQNKSGVKLGTDRLTSDGYSQVGAEVPKSELEKGDLVFFQDNDGIVHGAGIYLGADTFIQASQSYGRVLISSFSDHLANPTTGLSDNKQKTYEQLFVGARRVLGTSNITQGVASTFQEGDTGTDVKEIQINLNTLGYRVENSGNFDTATIAAVKAFEKSFGFPENGTIDQAELDALREAKLSKTCRVCAP